MNRECEMVFSSIKNQIHNCQISLIEKLSKDCVEIISFNESYLSKDTNGKEYVLEQNSYVTVSDDFNGKIKCLFGCLEILGRNKFTIIKKGETIDCNNFSDFIIKVITNSKILVYY